jgi:hypothetical protein
VANGTAGYRGGAGRGFAEDGGAQEGAGVGGLRHVFLGLCPL